MIAAYYSIALPWWAYLLGGIFIVSAVMVFSKKRT
jgi:hypothetical protein